MILLWHSDLWISYALFYAFHFSTLFQINMPKCHKIYPNCICQVPTERHTLGYYSTLLTKVYWNYANHIVRVCVTPISPNTSKLDLTDKSNLHVHFGSKAMASLYDLLCYHSLTSTDLLLEVWLSYLPTRFHSHIFDYIAYEHCSDEESVHSINSSFSAFNSDDSTYFPWKLLCFLYFLCNSKILPQKLTHDSKKWPPAENDRRPEGGPEALDNPEAARVGEDLQLLPPFLGSPGGEQSQPLPTVEAGELVITR